MLFDKEKAQRAWSALGRDSKSDDRPSTIVSLVALGRVGLDSKWQTLDGIAPATGRLRTA